MISQGQPSAATKAYIQLRCSEDWQATLSLRAHEKHMLSDDLRLWTSAPGPFQPVCVRQLLGELQPVSRFVP
jgi:hypothetical protein